MRSGIKYCVVVVCAAVVGCLTTERVFAQSSYRTARDRENRIIDVVDDLNALRLDAAKQKLSDMIAAYPDDDAAHYYMGLVSFAQGNTELAEAEITRAVQLDSSNFWYRHRLAGVYARTDRQELSAEIYSGLLADFPKRSELYYELVDTYLSLDRMEEALETLERIETELGRSEAAVMTRYNILYYYLDREEEAYSVLEEYNRDYSSPQVLSAMGDYNISVRADSVAIACYNEALDLAPAYGPALIGRAETYRISRNFENYFPALNELVVNEEVPVDGICDYLSTLTRASHPSFLKTFNAELDEVMENCKAAHPQDSSVIAVVGVYYYVTDRLKKSMECFKENMENFPDSPEAAMYYAESLMYNGLWTELSVFSKTEYDKFPDTQRFLDLAIYADYNLKDYDGVFLTCQRLIAVASDDETMLSAYLMMGDMYYKMGEAAKAYKTYDLALKIKADYAPVLNNYAYFLSLEGKNLKKAESMSRIAVEQQPDNSTYLDTYGWILYLQGKPEEAKAHFKHAMLYGGRDSAVVMDHYGDVLYALKEYDLAFLYWNQALSKDSDNEIPGLSQKIKDRRESLKGK